MKTFEIIEAVPAVQFYKYIIKAETEDEALEIISNGMGELPVEHWVEEDCCSDPEFTIQIIN